MLTPGLLLPLMVVAAPHAPDRALARAVSFFEAFEDEKAATLFREVLARRPPGAVAAKAHLYLGLIALNDVDPDLARMEFRLAIESNPAVELPPNASPKARFAFDQAQEELAQKAQRGGLVLPPSETVPPPEAPVAAAPTAAVSEVVPRAHGIAPATWWLGGIGVGAVAAGTVLGVLAGGNGNSDSGVNHAVTGPSYVTGQYEGLAADIAWSVGGALVVSALIVALASH